MKLYAFATLFTLVAAHDIKGRHASIAHKRQAAASSASSSVTSSASSASSVSSGISSTTVLSTPSGASSMNSTGTTSLSGAPSASPIITTTPLGPGTDIPPLSSIVSGMAPEATASVTTTFAPSATPSYMSGAPPLPSAFVYSAADWPAQDKLPDTTTDQVQQWMKELDGFDIPDLTPTTDGTCAGDPAAVSDAANRGWWTCGGWTRPTDIISCPDKLTWGLSYDDGPSPYTQKLLNYLDQKNLLATFFVVGSRTIEFPTVLLEEYMTGHELSVHTWSHPYLTSLTNEQIVAELGWTRLAIQTITGVTPVTMRPPYGDIDDRVRAIALAMGMVPIIWTRAQDGSQFDTNDWHVPAGLVTGEQSFQQFQTILSNATALDTGFIVLQHDLFEATVDLAIGYTLNAALNFTPTMKLEPIGKCQGFPASDMYLETTKNTTFPYLNSTVATIATTTASVRAAAESATAKSNSSGGGSSSGAFALTSPVFSSLFAMGLVLVGGLLMA